jgi:hypothetical protein
MRDEHGFFRTSDPGTYSFESLLRLHAEGRLYAPFGGAVVVDEATRRIYGSNGGNIGVKYYLTQLGNGRHGVERAVDNIWDDIPGLGTTPGEDLGYPTQKTEALLERVITTATQPGDWVIDPFAGSGTTLAVAQKLGRRWIGCDAAMGAIQTTTRRLYATMQGQVSGAPHHASVTFAVYHSDETRRLADPGAPQMDLSITRIDGQEARIRIVVEQVTWPPDAGVVCSDWRTAVDSIAIDPAYDGQVLRVALADAPLKKTLLVTGIYTMAAPAYPTTIAVRVTDVWGRETIVTHKV